MGIGGNGVVKSSSSSSSSTSAGKAELRGVGEDGREVGSAFPFSSTACASACAHPGQSRSHRGDVDDSP